MWHSAVSEHFLFPKGRPELEPFWRFFRYAGADIPIPDYDMSRQVDLAGVFIEDGGVYQCVLQVVLQNCEL